MTAAGATVGVEEEYQLVDLDTMRLADRPQVVAAARGLLGEQATGEISTSQLEVATAVCRTLDELRAELVRLRAGCREAAARYGCGLLPAGTHPTAHWRQQRLTPGVRYLDLVQRWGLLALQQLITGCHVHVAVPDAEVQARALGRLGVDLPVLLALSGSSPYWEGADTGYASYRTLWFSRFQVTGPALTFADRAEYDATVAELVAAGIVEDASHLYWDARPSTRYPTLEVRVGDTMPLVDDVVLHAGLARSLVRTSAAAVLENRPAVPLRPETARAVRWRAARHGLEGLLYEVRDGGLLPAGDVVHRLLARQRDDLEQAGEWEQLSDLAEAALARGTSAHRQRSVLERTGDLDEVTRAVLAEGARG